MIQGQIALRDEDRFDLALRLKTAIWLFDIDNAKIINANEAACKLWQVGSVHELVSRDLSKDMSSSVGRRLKQYQTDFEERDATFNEVWTLYPNGVPTSVLVNFTGYRLLNGRMAMQCEVVAQTDDQPENLRSVEALLHIDVYITLFPFEGPPLYMNPAARSSAFDARTQFSSVFADSDDHTLFMFEIDRKGEHRMVCEVNTTKGRKWFDLSVKSCLDAVTGDPALLATAIDVSELKTARDTARYLAERDQLTGCYNRSYILDQYSDLKKDEAEPCILLYFDVDRFKLINDSLGHETGDKVLKEIVRRTRQVIRDQDVLVRLGGDEFVILFHSIEHIETLMPVIERLKEVLSEPLRSDNSKVQVSVSIGLAKFDPSQVDFETALHQADTALYASKQNGRNQFTVFNDKMGAVAEARDRLEVELGRAIEEHEFVLYYQPRHDVTSGRIVSAEALVRWQHPTKGLVPPNEFIPICEETGMIEELGLDVFEMGYRQAVSWSKAGLDISVSINISPRQFQDDRIFDKLAEYATRNDYPNGKIELEITENVLIGDQIHIVQKLEKITSLGYKISIDDFGTGYSNLAYISRFPLHFLKIDRSFVKQLPDSGPIIDLIITLAKQIGATVVAEGAESEDEILWLKKHACDQIQGYYFCRPLPIREFEKYLEDHGCITKIPNG